VDLPIDHCASRHDGFFGSLLNANLRVSDGRNVCRDADLKGGLLVKDSRPLLESQAPDLTILDVSNIFRCPYWQDDLELGAIFAVR